jgi:hypothetical protein
MVALPQVYNTADLPDTGGNLVLIPPGDYQAVIVKSEMKPTKDSTGQFLALTVIITQGQFQNTEFIERLNIVNQNAQAVEIAYKTLARISEAVGMAQTPSDSNQLHNKPMIVVVETEVGKPYTKDGVERQGKDKSVIKKYKPLPAVGVAASFGAPQAVSQQSAAIGAVTPPWAKK